MCCAMAVRAWRDGKAPVDGGEMPTPREFVTLSRMQLFRGGFLISVSNPKLILFAAAFLPQFVDPAAAQAPQFAILVVTFAVVESIWYAIYALGGRSLARHLERPGLRRIFDRITGGIFVAFGIALLRIRPN
jgi:threonine/homoserine/homoserine lactone efflux protein